MFVNNEQTLLKMYEFLFPHQQSFKAKQTLKNPSDLIRLNEASQMGLPFNETLTEATGLGLSLNQSQNHMLFNNQRSYNEVLDTSGYLNELDSSRHQTI